MVFTGILIVFTGILICKTIRNIKRILGELYISKRILTTSHDKKSDGQNRYEIQTDVRDMFIILLVIVKCVCVYECVCVCLPSTEEQLQLGHVFICVYYGLQFTGVKGSEVMRLATN